MAKTHVIKTRITKQAVERLLPNEIIRDTDLVGFGVRRQSGAAHFFLQKRIGAKVRWITIGRFGSPWTPETARKEAYRLLGQVADGQLPSTRRQDLAARPTLTEITKLFMAEHGTHLKRGSLVKYQYVLDAFICDQLGDRLIDSINRADVLKLHAKMARTPALANYSVSVLSKLMSWAEEHNHRPMQSNPCWHLKRYRENKRQRFLSQAEYERLGEVLDRVEAADEHDRYIVAAIRLLLLTGARVGEIITLQWPWVVRRHDRLTRVLPHEGMLPGRMRWNVG